MKQRYLTTLLAVLALHATGCPEPEPSPGNPNPVEPTACERTRDCPVDMVCDALAAECVPELSCAEHAECGVDAYCDDGQCQRSTTGVACATDDNCYAGDSCFAGHCGCAGESILPERVPPNVLIVLDRSGSMSRSGGSASKWDLAVAAVESMLRDFDNDIRFGLVLYNNGTECGAGGVDVEIGVGTATQINAALAATGPAGGTPIGDTLDALVGYGGLMDPSRDNYVLLLTDGAESCEGDAAAAAAALASQAQPVQTYVVGFGDGVDAGSLNAIAAAGGTNAGNGNDRYYQADDGASLQAAFDDIATTVIGCTFQLPPAPSTASQLFVYLGDTELPAASTGSDGWVYDPSTEELTLDGPACAALATSTEADLSFVRGCPPYVE